MAVTYQVAGKFYGAGHPGEKAYNDGHQDSTAPYLMRLSASTLSHALSGSVSPGKIIRYQRGMNIIEVMIVVAIMAALAAVALPSYTGYRERQKLIQVRKDFSIIETRIEKYQANNGGNFPPDLAAISITRNDPWGNQYQYRSSGTGEGNGQVREYSGTPVNTDFDLYSMGPDGGSVKSLTETLSLDDIVRADDGDFIGRAEDY